MRSGNRFGDQLRERRAKRPEPLDVNADALTGLRQSSCAEVRSGMDEDERGSRIRIEERVALTKHGKW